MKNKSEGSLEQMKVLVSAAPCGVVVSDAHDKSTLFINDAFLALFGNLSEEVESEQGNWLDMVVPEDRSLVLDNLRALDAATDIVECKFRITRKDEQVVLIAMRSSFVELGNRQCLISYLTDITSGDENKSATMVQKEADIEAYGKQLKIIDDVNEKDLIYKGRCNLTMNKTLYEQCMNDGRSLPFGEEYDKNLEMIAQTAASANEASKIMEMFGRHSLIGRFEQGITETSYTYMRKSQATSLLWTELWCHTLRIPETDEVMCFAYAYDRSVQVLESKVVKRLAETEHDYLAIIDLEDRLVYMYNIKQEAEETNPRKTPKYDDDVTFAVERVVAPEDREHALACMSLENIVSQLDENGFYSFSFSVIDPKGKMMRKALNYCYLDDSKRDVLMSRTDVTALYNAEQEQIRKTNEAMQAAQKASAAKSDFLSNMSHEIRTPMNAIMGLTQLSREELVGNDVVVGYLESIEQSSNYLLSIINDILDMSRIESGKLEMDYTWVAQNALLDSCIRMILPEAKKRHITLSYPERINKVAGLEYRIDLLKTQRMLMNLLNNAVKFTSEGGHVSLSFKNQSFTDRMSVDQIIIEDDGCGMSEEFLTRIFNPFEQEHNEYSGTMQGTGLGLALARQTARAMGGDITVESKLGVGSKFTVIFPYEYRQTKGDDASRQAARDESRASLEGLQVLLCEDNQVNALVARKLLESRGCSVDWAENGEEGLERFGASPYGHYGVILMDVRMPKMDGLETTKAIRSLERPDVQTVNIVAMTAGAFNEDRKLCYDAGMDSFLTKPIDPKSLYEELRRVSGGRFV